MEVKELRDQGRKLKGSSTWLYMDIKITKILYLLYWRKW